MSVFSAMELSDLLLWVLLSASIYFLLIHKSRRDRLLDVFSGPPRPPIIGHTLDFLFTPKEELFPLLLKWCDQYGPVVKTFSGSARFLTLSHPKYIEKVLTSTSHIQKGADYDNVRPWLGDGLLMSSGQKWFQRRKMLTPAFHFKILEDFLPIFNKESLKMVDILRAKYGNGKSFDFCPFITRCTLDIICETAMGYKLNAQDGENMEYSKAIREVGEVMQDRAFRPWFRFDFLWKRSALYRRQEELLKILHGFTDSVISQRKKDRIAEKKNSSKQDKTESKNNDDIYFGAAKKRNAFLDLLLDVQEEIGTTQLSDQDLREETDTFMFEGHDTTSVGITFTVYALGAYPDIQAKVREEIESIFGDDKTRPVTTEDLPKMKYLECVIKESLRIYPSVPFIQRYLTSDLKIDDKITIPGDVTVALFIYQVHQNPEFFPEPKVFNPERFREGSASKNPFAYIPFSAGARNCIGQKFAMMEEKVIIANIIRNFRIKSLKNPKNLVIQSELTLRSPDGIFIELTPY